MSVIGLLRAPSVLITVIFYTVRTTITILVMFKRAYHRRLLSNFPLNLMYFQHKSLNAFSLLSNPLVPMNVIICIGGCSWLIGISSVPEWIIFKLPIKRDQMRLNSQIGICTSYAASVFNCQLLVIAGNWTKNHDK